ncbi:MAG: MFS transporter [Bryobacteraceae bacterium]
MRFPVSARWVAIAVIALASALNFLDRQVLAALAPQIMREFSLSAGQYGDVIFAFSMCYALAAPLAGLFIDRLGLRVATSITVAAWSLAGLSTGLTRSLGQLVLCRSALGVAEGGGIPSSGKACAVYLLPGERALGSGITQMGLSLGAIVAPIVAETCARLWGWRAAFVVAGGLGFVWLPLWLWISRGAPAHDAVPSGHPEGTGASPTPKEAGVAAGRGPGDPPHLRQTRSRSSSNEDDAAPRPVPASAKAILADPRYLAILAANVLLMLAYSLWVNWTTIFLVRVHHLSQHQANVQLAWIPPVFASAGGLFGGWLALRWFRGHNIVTARLRIVLTSALVLLGTAVVPLAPTAATATALIGVSFFACVLGSVNIYSLPLDLYGARHAAFAVSGLTSVYGLLQGAFSSLAGRVIDAHGFTPVCMVVALCPLGAWLVLRLALGQDVRKEQCAA